MNQDGAEEKTHPPGAYRVTEKNFRKIMGYQDLWALAAVLGRSKK